MTYSIVARDPKTGILGVAAQSHFFSVGSVATFAEAGVGAISTQAFASRQYGAIGIDLLRSGLRADKVLEALLKLDTNTPVRQVGIVDAQGNVANFTGERCVQYASHLKDDNVSVQGNMLAAPGIPEAMLAAYKATDGDMAASMLAALDAAEATGGDARGVQSASIYIVGPGLNKQPWHAVLHDERVDDHPDPLGELRRLVSLRRAYQNIGGILFDEGPLFSKADTTSKDAVNASLAALSQSTDSFGEASYEATLWKMVLLARYNRFTEAKNLMPVLIKREPKLLVFIRALASSGFLPVKTVEDLLSDYK